MLIWALRKRGGAGFCRGAGPPLIDQSGVEKKFAEIFEILELRTLDVSRDFSFGRPQKGTDRGQLWSFKSGGWRSLQQRLRQT